MIIAIIFIDNVIDILLVINIDRIILELIILWGLY